MVNWYLFNEHCWSEVFLSSFSISIIQIPDSRLPDEQGQIKIGCKEVQAINGSYVYPKFNTFPLIYFPHHYWIYYTDSDNYKIQPSLPSPLSLKFPNNEKWLNSALSENTDKPRRVKCTVYVYSVEFNAVFHIQFRDSFNKKEHTEWLQSTARFKGEIYFQFERRCPPRSRHACLNSLIYYVHTPPTACYTAG